MTAAAPLGALRHRLTRLEASPPAAPARPASSKPPSSSRSQGQARLTGLAFRLYAFLSARRRKLLPFTTRAAGFLDHRLITAPAGAMLLRSVVHQLDRHPALGAVAVRLLRVTLVATAQVQLAASRKPDAMRAARLLNLIFRAQVRARRGLASSAYFSTLALCGAYDRLVREVPRPEPIDSFAINFAVGVAHMYRGSYPAALHFLKAAAASGDSNALRRLGCVHALMGDYAKAAENFQASVDRNPRSVMAHQNYAGGYDSSAYTPSAWEQENAGELLIYDNLIQLGENFYHQGRYEDTLRCYQSALDHQDALSRKWSIPDTLVQRIAAGNANFKPDLPVRLLGYEWVTLIGHVGFIDCHLRMAVLGMLPRANYVLLAPRHKVVNPAFLTLIASNLTVIEDSALVDELLPYQRLVGDQFIAVRGNGPLAEPWAHAVARAQVAWADAKRGPLVAIPQDLRERGHAALRAAGVTADWFVAIHIREGGYHGDGPGTTRQHRSADVGDYLDAIAEITARGGAVVRLGDKSMTPLRNMPGVFDYAHSDIKSAEMDLFLCAEARLFIGTTSGLTTAVQALGTPMLLVNCTSNDCQFWHDRTSFTVRPVYDRRARRYLSLRETYRQPLQAMLIDTAVLARHGLEIHANRPEDITAAVRYSLDCLDGVRRPLRDGGELLDRYRSALADNPYNFGAALPVPSFLESFPELLKADAP
jgi:putative glycosyltransferase (TIGR04372 family)